MRNNKKDLLYTIIGALIIIIPILILYPTQLQNYFPGFSILTILTVYGMVRLINWSGREKPVIWIMVFAFLLRFGLGIFFTVALPEIGYETDPQQAGYLFADAFQRDSEAWVLAASDDSLLSAFKPQSFYSDQYGGLLAISATIYRLFSPHTHFKINILLLTAFFSVMAIPVLWKALKMRSDIIRYFVILFIAFYPDAILYSASEMREGFIIGLSAWLFYFASKEKIRNWRFLSYSVFISFILILINFKIGFFVIFSTGIWLLLFNSEEFPIIHKKRWVTVSVITIVIVAGIIGFRWLMDSSQWDAVLLVKESGWVEVIIHQIGKRYRLPFATIYGILRPLLPASIIEDSIPLWKSIAIIRSLSWYMVLPVFFYGFVYSIKLLKKDNGKQLIFWLLLLFWIGLSAMRAGGDQWDNPRYRINLIVLLALFLAETVSFLIQTKDHWFFRILTSELVFLLFFLYWYINRYFAVLPQINFYQMVVMIALIIMIIFGLGFYHEYRRFKRKKTN